MRRWIVPIAAVSLAAFIALRDGLESLAWLKLALLVIAGALLALRDRLGWLMPNPRRDRRALVVFGGFFVSLFVIAAIIGALR